MPRKIKSIRKYSQRYKNLSFSELMSVADEEFLETVIELDAEGRVLSESKFANDGELEENNLFSYNPQGKLTEHVLVFAVEDVTEKRVLKRNEKGLLLEEVKYYGDDTGERFTYTYNEKEDVTSITRFDEDGVFDYCEEMTYDSGGSLAERVKKDQSGNVLSKMMFSKNTDDHSVEENEYKSDGTLESKTVYKFDESGREISAVQTTKDGKLISSVVSVYDENGDMVERHYKDFFSKLVKNTYDDQHRILTTELFDNTGLLLRKNIHTYDEEGNLATEQTFEMDTSRGGRDKHFGTRYEYEFAD